MLLTHSDNLPLELSSFVGREQEISEVEGLLASSRLLTLTGTGGCGKTRLALKVTRNLAREFEDGAWWAGLAPLADPGLVPKSVASALGVGEQPGRSMTEALSEHLRFRELMLVLDNCEHLIGACAALVEALLLSCPDLKILATSREPLGVAGETDWAVPPLSLPATEPPSLDELARCEAIRLFVERAAAAKPGFAPTEINASAVVEVCRELEGIPLAIELAAARVKVLGVQQIAERLDDCFGLLTTGCRTALPRQRTLRATIDWSHELLSEAERTLLRRLSVFAGGFTLEVAEEVCSGEGTDEEGRSSNASVLNLLSSLVQKSLVVVEEWEAVARYRLLETIRQYAAEKLRGSGEAEAIRRRHAASFLSLAEEAEPAMVGSEQVAWSARLEREHDNLRAALGWLGKQGEAECGLRLAAALVRFWFLQGHLAEGRAWLEALLDRRPGAPVRDEVRARALHTLGVLIYRHAEDAGNWTVARSRLEESLEIYRELEDEPRVAAVLQDLGRVGAEAGEWTMARSVLDECLQIGRRLGDKNVVALSLFGQGRVCWLRGEHSPAKALLQESLGLFRELDDKYFMGACLYYLGSIDCDEGDYAASRSRFLQMNELGPLMQLPWGVTHMLEGFARLAAAEGQASRSLRLAGATDAQRQKYGVSNGPGSNAIFERGMEPAWRALGEVEGRAAWEEGRAMALEVAFAYAMEEPKPDRPAGGNLSARELEVLSLVAGGLTDVQIADRLYLSRHTVGHHLSSVYHKLRVHGRAAAVHKAGEMGLI